MLAATVACCGPCSHRVALPLCLRRLHLSHGRTILPPAPSRFQTYNSTLQYSGLSSASASSGKQGKKKRDSPPYPNRAFLDEPFSSPNRSKQRKGTHNRMKNPGREAVQAGNKGSRREVVRSNRWWADLMAAIGQRFNFEGILSSVMVVAKDRQLALPLVALPDIRHIDWGELRRAGFKGVVFDKDNTITAPYSLSLWRPLLSSIDQCKHVFGNNIAIFSNSAGLHQYDPDGCKAGAIEKATGIRVIRHRMKKPSGSAEEIEKHFSCQSSHLVMVGDRHFTDIVYGNRNGFFTILSQPLSPAEDPFIVKQMRKLEGLLVKRWLEKGLKPPTHSLLPEAVQCVKESWPL